MVLETKFLNFIPKYNLLGPVAKDFYILAQLRIELIRQFSFFKFLKVNENDMAAGICP